MFFSVSCAPKQIPLTYMCEIRDSGSDPELWSMQIPFAPHLRTGEAPGRRGSGTRGAAWAGVASARGSAPRIPWCRWRSWRRHRPPWSRAGGSRACSSAWGQNRPSLSAEGGGASKEQSVPQQPHAPCWWTISTVKKSHITLWISHPLDRCPMKSLQSFLLFCPPSPHVVFWSSLYGIWDGINNGVRGRSRTLCVLHEYLGTSSFLWNLEAVWV